jgi:hypothetical protein
MLAPLQWIAAFQPLGAVRGGVWKMIRCIRPLSNLAGGTRFNFFPQKQMFSLKKSRGFSIAKFEYR